MDTVYAVLFTAGTIAAMILATLFFFNQQQTPPSRVKGSSGKEAESPAPSSSPTPQSPLSDTDTTDYSPTQSPTEDSGEDADGPINLTAMPASDDDIWKVWFDQPNQVKGMSKGQFEDSMKVLGTFNTMADFWDRFSNLMHEKLPTKSNVRVFQSNVRPLWEDPVNCEGGKWIVVIPKQKSVGVFNEVLAAMVGGKFACEVSGLVLSKKVREDLVSVWTPSGLPVPSLEALRDNISKLLETHLGLKPEITFMSHDKKNKVNIQGRGEKKGAQGAPTTGNNRAASGKFNGVKPQKKAGGERSTGAKPPRGEGVKPKSPTLGPRAEKTPKEPEAPPPGDSPKDGDAKPSPSEDGEWEVVRSKAKKEKSGNTRNRFKSL